MKFFSPLSQLRCERTFSSMSSPKLALEKLVRRSPPAWLGSCSVGWENNQVSQSPGDLDGEEGEDTASGLKVYFNSNDFQNLYDYEVTMSHLFNGEKHCWNTCTQCRQHLGYSWLVYFLFWHSTFILYIVHIMITLPLFNKECFRALISPGNATENFLRG